MAGAELSAKPPAETATLSVGDVVLLSALVPQEFRNTQAVITRTERSHCTVCVLDETGRFGIGECWPSFADVKLVSSTLRLGNRMVVDGCSGSRTRWLNGHAATIVSHRREGHPCFVHSKRHLNRPPQFNVCICLERPPSPGERLVLIEPRFLSRFDQFAEEATNRLGAVVRHVSTGSLGSTPRCLTPSPSSTLERFASWECDGYEDRQATPDAVAVDGPATARHQPRSRSIPVPRAPRAAQEHVHQTLAHTVMLQLQPIVALMLTTWLMYGLWTWSTSTSTQQSRRLCRQMSPAAFVSRGGSPCRTCTRGGGQIFAGQPLEAFAASTKRIACSPFSAPPWATAVGAALALATGSVWGSAMAYFPRHEAACRTTSLPRRRLAGARFCWEVRPSLPNLRIGMVPPPSLAFVLGALLHCGRKPWELCSIKALPPSLTFTNFGKSVATTVLC